MKKKLIIYSFGFLSLILVIVIADYFALFGVSEKQELDFAEINFESRDEETNAPIYDAHANCFRHQNHDACTVRESKRNDIVRIQFPFHKVIERSWFFQQGERIKTSLDGEINIMIIHNDYHNVTQSFDMKNIYKNSGQRIDIKMKAKDWPEKASE